ncbi:pyrimidine dimer DNA glycosylase/endonuclease V [Brachybacterium hainanense]|uniref:Pyrimidine dimer DNA glycosylase/endonuclease V n=1 Tax=Brachybacterium hainanense TaxID=1541174 RepID=A0ABV6R9M0_9MICO
MRLWSLDPAILDRAALVAGWREALLAQKVLAGGTRGYRHHPQLRRFQEQDDPLASVGAYLVGLQRAATARGYRFDATRILRPEHADDVPRIPVTAGQLAYEREHLRAKVSVREPGWLPRLPADGAPVPAHPLLETVPGPVEDWEVVAP